MKFKECATYFQAIEQEPSRTAMTKILSELLMQATAEDAKIISYLSLGSLFPPYKDLQFNIAQKNMISILAEFLNLTDATITRHVKEAGDVGLVVFELWTGQDHGLSLHEIYHQLIEVAQISGTGSTEKKS